MSASAVQNDDKFPSFTDKYEVERVIGRGGMGTVFEARHTKLGQRVAIKVLGEDLRMYPELVRRFEREARAASALSSPHAVRVFDIDQTADGTPFFVMEMLTGHDLSDVVTNDGPQPVGLAVRWLIEASDAIAEAHRLGIIHRDIKPSNLLLCDSGLIKVLDFGIAKASDSSSQTRTGIIKGKVAYMAPEQFRSGSVDRRADVFALGAILWRTIAGRRLWKNMTDVEVYQHLAAGTIPSPTEVNPDASPELVAICMKALAPNPGDRYQSAAELQTALEEFLDHSPEKVSPRTIGKQVSELFADRRAAVKNAIEERLASGVPAPTSLSTIPTLNSGLSREVESAPDVSVVDRASSVPSGGTIPSRGQTALMPGVSLSPEPRPSQLRTVILLGAAVLSVVAAGVIVMRVRSADHVTQAPTTEAAPAADVILAIDTDPPTAEVKLDALPIEHKTTIKRDGALHRLSVEAPGYAPHIQMLDLASAPVMDLHIALERLSETAAPVASTGSPVGSSALQKRSAAPVFVGKQTKPSSPVAARSASETPPPTAPAPVPVAPTPTDKGGLDTGDPWGKKK